MAKLIRKLGKHSLLMEAKGIIVTPISYTMAMSAKLSVKNARLKKAKNSHSFTVRTVFKIYALAVTLTFIVQVSVRLIDVSAEALTKIYRSCLQQILQSK